MNHFGSLLGMILGAAFWSISSLTWGMTSEEQALPTPLGYVSDYAGLLNDEWYAQIRAVCKDVETNTGVEMLVVSLDTIQPHSHAQDYASRLYEAWRIGTAQQERGILLLVAAKEQQAVVVVGKNLLPVILPQQLDDLSLKYLQPMFQSGDYGTNVYRSVLSLASMAGKVSEATEKRQSRRITAFWMNVMVVVVMVYALWRFTRPERRHPFPRWKRGEYWGIGQGGFGGNFGGWGGATRGQNLR